MKKDLFTEIFKNWKFGGWPESHSGDNSTIKHTINLAEEINKLVKEKNIKIVVDIPCGDFNWMKTIAYDFDTYIGGDIVTDLIDETKKFATSTVNFIEIDLTADNVKIPEGDLLIVRDLMGHLSIDDNLKVVDNILKSNCKYVLITTLINIQDDNFFTSDKKSNIPNINKGNDLTLEKIQQSEKLEFNPICLLMEPFNFPKPEFYIEEVDKIDEYELGVRKVLALYEIDKLKGIRIEKEDENELVNLINKYDCDKVTSGYYYVYDNLFKKHRNENFNYLEIGLGSLLLVESTHIGTLQRHPNFKPSSILKVWKDYFTNANIYGIDIAEDCMIDEDRIKTFLVSSIDKNKCSSLFGDLKFKIILDDGCHKADIQFLTFLNFFDRVEENGYYIIEDIGGGGDGIPFYEKYVDKLRPIIDQHEYYYDWNILVIRKNNSAKGCHFGNFRHDVKLIYDCPGFDSFLMEKEPHMNYNHPAYDIWFRNNKTVNPAKPQKIEIKNDIKIENINTEPVNNLDENKLLNKNLTIVTGLWNLNRPGRDFTHYIEHFKLFLDIPQNLFIYIPKEYEYLVWEKRDKKNTFVKIYELEDIKQMYQPFWDKTHEIRKNPDWYNQAGWLPGSPQAYLEMYNPIVQSKMFMLHDVSIWNPFSTDYFFWLDAGITNTVPHTHLVENNTLAKLTDYGNPFLFLSYPYEASNEIHGFTFSEMNKIAGEKVQYVCRGGLFGGHKEQLREANATYYSILNETLNKGLMGTEESIFSLMAYLEPNIYRRYELDGNGLIVKFTQALIDNTVKLAEAKVKKINNFTKVSNNDVLNVKTNLYVLTFNFPEQLIHTINSMKKNPEWLKTPHLVLLDNSTDQEAKIKNLEIANEYNFEYIDLGSNRGICGGRQAAAEHFHESDADFMFFFEDDMTSNPPEMDGQFCRNGFRKYINNLYYLVHKIMLKEKFDFLKLTFTEVYFDNDKQCSWYNVPQNIRTRDWPDYDKLPVSGLDPNAPLTNFKNIRNMDGVCYIDGEIYYANWPMIVSKEGNYKMFIQTKWAYPYEQTWMSHMYQLTKEGKLRPAVLLASPIWHDRIKYYQPNERREN